MVATVGGDGLGEQRPSIRCGVVVVVVAILALLAHLVIRIRIILALFLLVVFVGGGVDVCGEVQMPSGGRRDRRFALSETVGIASS